MDKNEVLKKLVNDEFPNGIAEVICDIASNGKVCYPNESILVVVLDPNEYAVNDDQINNSKHFAVFVKIDDFNDRVVYGRENAKELHSGYSSYYVSDFKEVKPFVSDFEQNAEQLKTNMTKYYATYNVLVPVEIEFSAKNDADAKEQVKLIQGSDVIAKLAEKINETDLSNCDIKLQNIIGDELSYIL